LPAFLLPVFKGSVLIFYSLQKLLIIYSIFFIIANLHLFNDAVLTIDFMLIYGTWSLLLGMIYPDTDILFFFIYERLPVWIEMAGGVIQQLLRRKLQSHSPVSISSSLCGDFVLLLIFRIILLVLAIWDLKWRPS
jgi:hypothetical protein